MSGNKNLNREIKISVDQSNSPEKPPVVKDDVREDLLGHTKGSLLMNRASIKNNYLEGFAIKEQASNV